MLYVIVNVSPSVECPVGVSLGPFWTANIALTNCLQCHCISRDTHDWEHRGTSHTLSSSLLSWGLIRGRVKLKILIINNYKATVFVFEEILMTCITRLKPQIIVTWDSNWTPPPPLWIGTALQDSHKSSAVVDGICVKTKHFQYVVLSCGDFSCITALLV